jgi:hypothetical protein
VTPFDSSGALKLEICITLPTVHHIYFSIFELILEIFVWYFILSIYLMTLVVQMQIVVMTFEKKYFPLMVRHSDTIADVKKKIFNRNCSPVNRQLLYLNYKELQDRHTIAYYHIKEKSIIRLFDVDNMHQLTLYLCNN